MAKKIVFMGTSGFAVPILKSIYQNGFPISMVYTQAPQRSHRGQKINKSKVQLLSEILKLEFRTPLRLKNDLKEQEFFKNLNADLVIVVAYGQIIPKEFLNFSKSGFINIHASILPKWRGAAPIQRSLMNLDKETGISVMKINEKLDEGPIFKQYNLKINLNENYQELSERLSRLASEKIFENIDEILEGNVKFIEQDNKKATYAKKISKLEGKIDWNESSEKIIGKINGLYPSPGAWFVFKGERYKILKAEVSNLEGKKGTVLGDTLEVACGSGAIKIIDIQRQGRKVQKGREFLLGSEIKKDTNLNNE